MGKVEKARKGGAASNSPYDRKSSAGKGAAATKNNVFKFNKDFGQHILKNPGVADGTFRSGLLPTTGGILTWLR